MGDDDRRESEDGVEEPQTPGWGPTGIWDNRQPLEWETKYPDPVARRWILTEAVYCFCIFLVTPLLMVMTWVLRDSLPLVAQSDAPVLTKYCYAWLGGMFGGVLFDIKWLYHSVAKEMWHQDRRLWRVLMPFLSGGLAFAVVMVMSSGMFAVFDRTALLSPSVSASIGFLVGYFSDSAVAKLSEVAGTLFGARETHDKGKSKPK